MLLRSYRWPSRPKRSRHPSLSSLYRAASFYQWDLDLRSDRCCLTGHGSLEGLSLSRSINTYIAKILITSTLALSLLESMYYKGIIILRSSSSPAIYTSSSPINKY